MTVVRELVVQINMKGDAAEKSKSLLGGLADVKAGMDIAIAGAKAAAQAIASFTTDIARQGDELAKTATNLGISVDGLERLEFAAKISGGSLQDVTKGIQTMQRGLFDARTKGTGPMTDSLAAMGLSIEDFDGLDPEEQFIKLSEAMSQVSDDTDKAGLAQSAFGRAGKTLIPLINQGAKGIRALGAEFEELGGGFTEDGARAAEEFQDSMLRLDTVIESVKIAVGSELLPVITEIIEDIKEWAIANGDAIKEDLVEFIKELTARSKQFGPTLEKILPLLADFTIFISEAIQETTFLIDNIGDLDDVLSDDLGPTWDALKNIIEGTLIPLTATIDLLKDADLIAAGLAATLGPLGKALNLLRDTEPGPGEGVRVTKKREKALLPAAGGGVESDVGRLNRAKSNGELRAIANSEKVRPAVRALANERLQASLSEDVAFVEGLLAPNADVAQVEQFIAANTAKAGGGRKVKRKRKAGAKRESEKVKSEELAKLISKAADEGIGLEGVLGGREIEGDVPPVLLVQITNNDVTVQADVDIAVTGVPGETAEDIALRVESVVEDKFQTEFQGALEEAASLVSR